MTAAGGQAGASFSPTLPQLASPEITEEGVVETTVQETKEVQAGASFSPTQPQLAISTIEITEEEGVVEPTVQKTKEVQAEVVVTELVAISSNEKQVVVEARPELVRVNKQILNYMKTLELGSILSLETIKDLADSAPTAGNVKILPAMMIGDFQLESSEGFDEFMYEMGVNMVTRKIVNQLYPLQQIRQDPADELITIETLTTFKNIKIEFKLGEMWEEYTADGRYTQTTATVEGDSLVKFQVLGQHTTYEIREFKEDGKEMVLHLVIPAKPEIICKRVYRRVPGNKEVEKEFGPEKNR